MNVVENIFAVVIIIILVIILAVAVICSILSIFSRQLNPITLCDIQDTSSQFKLIRNENGLMGISMWQSKRSKRLLHMKYDNIICINDDTFICAHNGFYGIYNATKRKMVVPMEYDSIESRGGYLYARRGNDVFKYTDRGYRVVE